MFVYKCVEYANKQEVEALQFMLRTKNIGKVRLTSSTTQTCILKSILVFFEVAYCPKAFKINVTGVIKMLNNLQVA